MALPGDERISRSFAIGSGMGHGRIRGGLVVLLLAALVVPAAIAPAIQRANGTPMAVGADVAAEETGAGLEARIERLAAGSGLVGVLGLLAIGTVLLTVCVEKLISYLTRAAFGLRLSLFALAIVFTGFEFDDTILALVLSAGSLEGAALGTALGTALSIVGVTLALAAIVSPFPVDLPTDYVVLFALAPVVLVPFVLLGTLTLIHGVALLTVFVLLLGYILVRESQRDSPVFRSSDLGEAVRLDGGVDFPASVGEIPEDRVIRGRTGAGWIWLVLAILTLGGVVFASMLLEAGSEVVVEAFGIEETVFGATVLAAILTFEDVMLTIEPIRRNVPEIGVGNVIGSVCFSVTANVGVIMLLGELTISASVLAFHLPAVILLTALAAGFLYRGQLQRWHGVLLGSLYVAYWLVAILVFGGVPISG